MDTGSSKIVIRLPVPVGRRPFFYERKKVLQTMAVFGIIVYNIRSIKKTGGNHRDRDREQEYP